MISWPDFIYFALPALGLWISGAVMAVRGRYRAAIVLTVSGIALYAAFIILFWAGLHRPPMRTTGETRLWYSFFMTLSGAAVYARWRYRWILPFSVLLAAVFIMVHLLKPEIHDQTLMPALQSGWFVPHVTVYMFSYSVIGCAAIMGVASLVRRTDRYLYSADSLMYVGTAFLTFGMLSGALWAKAAWGKIYGQMIAGANIFVYDHEKFTPADILQKIHDYRITSLCAPPTIYRFLIREDLSKYDLSSLEYCTTAGEALNYSVYETFLKITGIRLMEGFGQTETTLTLGTFPWMKPKPGSMGVPNPQYEIDLLKPDGRRAEEGEQGQIVIRAGRRKPVGLFKEYYRDEEKTRESWHDGCYYTGDLAWRDEDGYYWFVGRADDVIKSSGYRIGPFEVESALMTHPAVVECAITGVPDEIRVQVVKATVILSAEYKAKAGPELVKELQDHVKRVTAPYKYPRVIEFVDELPKTISGKIRRVEIREKDSK